MSVVWSQENRHSLCRLPCTAPEKAHKERGVMKIGSAFKGSYLKASDLNGARIVVTIDHVAIEKVGQGDDQDDKPIVYFAGKEKGLALNKTNANSITEILNTDETEEWRGRRIVLHPDKTDFNGKRVDCIRVAPAPKSGTTSRPTPPPPPPVEEPSDSIEITDADVPF